MTWGVQNVFRWFNQAEGIFWILLGLGLFVVMARRRRDLDLMTAAGLLFVAFGLSDFVEIHTGPVGLLWPVLPQCYTGDH
jgi:hypothetical protein